MVDLQNDFCRGGSLAVPEGEAIIPLANHLQSYFDRVVATKDWHPPDHMSFASNHPGYQVGEVITINDIPQVLWPDHCIEGSHGAEFHPDLDTSRISKVIYKGTDKSIDSYSAFFDNAHACATGLEKYLHSEKVNEVYIAGLATDYCVKYSTLDAVRLGFRVYVIEDACRGVELKSGDCRRAFEEMKASGIKVIRSHEIIKA